MMVSRHLDLGESLDLTKQDVVQEPAITSHEPAKRNILDVEQESQNQTVDNTQQQNASYHVESSQERERRMATEI